MPLGTFVVKYAGTIAGHALKKVLETRAEAAKEILLDRIRKGGANLSDLPEDEAAAITFRYMRAAEEGSARLNLKLLADVIAGQDAKSGRSANEFLMWADILTSLKSDEVIVLGILHRQAKTVDYKFRYTGEFWSECQRVLSDERKMSFSTSDSLAAALMRTGLVTILGGLMSQGHAYLPTTNLQKLAEMADLETYYMQEPYIA
ncbi:hypothetical protein [Agrobacterium larrymoorei]|uniref:hypothetical protein n=1 Tax=Agrobacterium larrymoorei TaxID=160699 RepID=UPI0030C0016B